MCRDGLVDGSRTRPKNQGQINQGGKVGVECRYVPYVWNGSGARPGFDSMQDLVKLYSVGSLSMSGRRGILEVGSERPIVSSDGVCRGLVDNF